MKFYVKKGETSQRVCIDGCPGVSTKNVSSCDSRQIYIMVDKINKSPRSQEAQKQALLVLVLLPYLVILLVLPL